MQGEHPPTGRWRSSTTHHHSDDPRRASKRKGFRPTKPTSNRSDQESCVLLERGSNKNNTILFTGDGEIYENGYPCPTPTGVIVSRLSREVLAAFTLYFAYVHRLGEAIRIVSDGASGVVADDCEQSTLPR